MADHTETSNICPDLRTGRPRATKSLPRAATERIAPEYSTLWRWNERNERSRQSDSIIDEEWVELFSSWMNWCFENHEECGQRELDSVFSDAEDILLIDTGRLCLTKAQTNYRYMALSYVWGPDSHLTTMTTTKSMGKLSAQDSLLQIWEQLPQVVQDAIDLTDRIGERFLWVDFLCIVQDDPYHLGPGHQLKLMAEIYNSASATFIACAGTRANVRLVPSSMPTTKREWRYTRIPRKAEQEIYRPHPLQAEYLLSTISASTHSKRGWTYQEKLLSRRCLYFLHDRIIFRCRADIFIHDGEDKISEEKDDSVIYELMSGTKHPGPSDFFSNQSFERDILGEESATPDYWDRQERIRKAQSRRFYAEWPRDMSPTDWYRGFKFWCEMVEEYSQKQFTFENDILAACSGVLTAFQKYSGWHIFHGCPEELLDYALLWVPRAECEARNRETRESTFPTWSWLRWKGGALFALALRENELCEYQNRLRYLSGFGQKVESYSYTASNTGVPPLPSSLKAYRTEPSVTFNNFSEGEHCDDSSLRFVAECVPASIFVQTENGSAPGDVLQTIKHSTWLSPISSSQTCGIMYGITADSFCLIKADCQQDELLFILLSDIRLTPFKSVNWKLAFESVYTNLRKQKRCRPRVKHAYTKKTASFPVPEASIDHNEDDSNTSRSTLSKADIPLGTIRNIMLIRRVGECFERVAVGHFSGASWIGAQPTEISVSLM